MRNGTIFLMCVWLYTSVTLLPAAEPKVGDAKRIDLGGNVTLEVVYLPPGEFMMGSTPEEKKWATGIEGGRSSRHRT